MSTVVGILVEDQSSGASFTPNFSNIVWDSTLETADKAILADDLILTGLANRQSTGTSFNTPTGYTKVGTYGVQSSTAHIWFYKKAAGGETGPAYTVTSAECIGITLIIRGVDATTQITASSARKDWVNVASFASDTPTAAAGDLVIHSCAYNNTNQYTRAKISELTGLARYDGSSVGLVVGYKQVESAGAIDAVTWYNKNATNGGQAWVICIKTASGAALQPDIRTAINELNWYGAHGAANTPVPTTNPWKRPSEFATGALGTLNGITLSTNGGTSTITAVTTSQPFGTAVGTFSSIPHAISETVWAGGWHAQAATDLRGALVSFQWAHDALSTSANVGAGGVIFAVSDGTDIVAYQVASKAKGWGLLVPNSAVIAMGNATAYASSGTIDTVLSAVTQFGFFWNRSASTATSLSLHVRNLLFIPTLSATVPAYSAHLTGGGSERPANLRDFYTAAQSWEYQTLCTSQAEGQLMPRIDVCFGDGTNKTYIDISAYPLSFPQAWSAADSGNWQMNWNVDTLALAVAVKTAATDTINLTATGIVAPNKQQLVIDAGSNTGATLSVAGSSIVGMSFTDNAGFALASGTLKNGGTVTLKASAIGLNVSKTVGAVPAVAMTANGKTLTDCTIDVTGTSATYHLSLDATVTAITLNGVTLTGTPATDKIYSALASGTLTITTDGLGTTLVAGDVTFVGGSTAVAVIAAPELYQSVAITGLAATYRLQLFDIEYDLTVSGITVTPTAGATYTHGGITWTVRAASITAGSGTITVYGTGTPATSGTLTKTAGTGDASVVFSAYAVGGTELYIGVPAATFYTWTDSVAAAAPRVIRVRVMEDGPGTGDAIEMIDAIVGMCGITDGTEAVGYLVAAVADDVYNDRGVDGSAITGITIDDTTLRLEIASGTITNYNGTDVLVVDGRDLYAYETYWLGTTAGMRDEARFIEAIDAVNFRCSNFKMKGTSGYPIMINNCFIVDAATGIFSSMVDYSGDPISNHPEHMKAIVVTTSDSVVTGTLAEFIAAVPTANAIATEVVTGITF